MLDSLKNRLYGVWVILKTLVLMYMILYWVTLVFNTFNSIIMLDFGTDTIIGIIFSIIGAFFMEDIFANLFAYIMLGGKDIDV